MLPYDMHERHTPPVFRACVRTLPLVYHYTVLSSLRWNNRINAAAQDTSRERSSIVTQGCALPTTDNPQRYDVSLASDTKDKACHIIYYCRLKSSHLYPRKENDRVSNKNAGCTIDPTRSQNIIWHQPICEVGFSLRPGTKAYNII